MKALQNQHQNVLTVILALAAVFLLAPFLLTFDSLYYLIVRPSCLQCGALTDFLRSQSLTAAMLSSLDVYKFKSKITHG
jgi:hypothetical protein